MRGVVGGAAGGPFDPEDPGPSILAAVSLLMTPQGVAVVRAARSSCLPLAKVAAAAGCSAAATADMLRMLHRSGGCTDAIVGALREPFKPPSRLVVAAAGVLRRRRGSGLLAPRAALPWESPDSPPRVTPLTFLGNPLCPPPQRRARSVQSRHSAVVSGHAAWAERTAEDVTMTRRGAARLCSTADTDRLIKAWWHFRRLSPPPAYTPGLASRGRFGTFLAGLGRKDPLAAFPEAMLVRLAGHPDRRARVVLGDCGTIPASVLRCLAADPYSALPAAAAIHSRCPQDVLKALAGHDDAVVRAAVVQNPAVSLPVLQVLRSDSDKSVAKAASRHYRSRVPRRRLRRR